MKIFVLFAQRKERYPGEYPPEAKAVMDEFGMDEIPEYMDRKIADAKANDDLESVALIPMEVDMDKIMALLRPVVSTNADVLCPCVEKLRA